MERALAARVIQLCVYHRALEHSKTEGSESKVQTRGAQLPVGSRRPGYVTQSRQEQTWRHCEAIVLVQSQLDHPYDYS